MESAAARTKVVSTNKVLSFFSCAIKPVSKKMEALNYDEWKICAPACTCGSQLNVPVYRFLKEPIIRKYGEQFYHLLEEADQLLNSSDHA